MYDRDTKVRIQGKLTRSKPEAVKGNTSSKIGEALRASRLRCFVDENKCNQGIIEFNSGSISFGGRHVASGLISFLSEFIKAEGVTDLGLEGNLLLFVESSAEPVMFRATVKDGKLLYQKATVQWEPAIAG